MNADPERGCAVGARSRAICWERGTLARNPTDAGGTPALPIARKRAPTCVLTIAGSDSGAGAGIQADMRTIHALGGFACTAITAVTAQNTRGVTRWVAMPPRMITAQIEAVLADLPITAVKTGLLPGTPAVLAVARALADRRLPLVVDPVIGSTSGTRFLEDAGLRALRRHLLPLATLVTPNRPEAEALTGRRVRSFDETEAAARALSDKWGCAVLIKGGHAPGAVCRDCLVSPGGRGRWFESPRVATSNTHGTGCVLSAAIATKLALGEDIATAVRGARAFLMRGLRAGKNVGWGGAGPAFAGD
ncbi:MAG TPA: bifunctional hydroxymethylpyrimidine kinase/phosphomethylpyrimidine kinase [Opitutaceae bacterium]